MMNSGRYAWRGLTLLLVLSLVLVSCQAAAPAAPVDQTEQAGEGAPVQVEETEKEMIRFADRQWQTHWINNAIAMFVIEHGYGYPVETVIVTTPVMEQSLPQGDLDVDIELWRMNVIDWYNEQTEAGTLIDLGPTFDESTQGWYVPRYVIEGDEERGLEPLAPDLKSVFDLADYTDVFQDPEDPNKGLLVNCITGWVCASVNRAKLHAYGLADMYNVMEPGASPALDAAIAGAYQKGEPILAYYWEPTWLMGAYDLVQLEEPEYTEECWAYIDQVLNGELDPADVPPEGGCAYERVAIHKGIYSGLQDRAPEVVEFLRNMSMPTSTLNELAAYMEMEDVDADETAIWFFENNSDLWREWLPQDVETLVEEALLDAGAQLSDF